MTEEDQPAGKSVAGAVANELLAAWSARHHVAPQVITGFDDKENKAPETLPPGEEGADSSTCDGPPALNARVTALTSLQQWMEAHGSVLVDFKPHGTAFEGLLADEEEEEISDLTGGEGGMNSPSVGGRLTVGDGREEDDDASLSEDDFKELEELADDLSGPNPSLETLMTCKLMNGHRDFAGTYEEEEEEDVDHVAVSATEVLAESILDIFLRNGNVVAEEKKISVAPPPRAPFTTDEYGTSL